MAILAAILKILKSHLLRNGKSNSAWTWWKALESYEDSEVLQSFCSNIQDGGYLEILQTMSPPHR